MGPNTGSTVVDGLSVLCEAVSLVNEWRLSQNAMNQYSICAKQTQQNILYDAGLLLFITRGVSRNFKERGLQFRT